MSRRMRISSANDFAILMKNARLDAGLTQAELADRVGKSRKWVVDVERGAINPTLSSVIDVCRVLEFSLSVAKQERLAGDVDLLALVLGEN
ncbi:MAG: helix-turn-helix domain-containing protein [Ancrocorticia sp.]